MIAGVSLDLAILKDVQKDIKQAKSFGDYILNKAVPTYLDRNPTVNVVTVSNIEGYESSSDGESIRELLSGSDKGLKQISERFEKAAVASEKATDKSDVALRITAKKADAAVKKLADISESLTSPELDGKSAKALRNNIQASIAELRSIELEGFGLFSGDEEQDLVFAQEALGDLLTKVDAQIAAHAKRDSQSYKTPETKQGEKPLEALFDAAKNIQSEVERVNDFELPTVAVSAQLGSVRAAVSAHNHALPAYIQADSKAEVGPQINLTADNPNTIKAYVLVNYPQIANLPEKGDADTKGANENLRNEVIDSFVKYVVDFRTKSFNTEPIRDRAQGDDDKPNPVRAHNNNNNWGINAEKSEQLLGILEVISEHITANTDAEGVFTQSQTFANSNAVPYSIRRHFE